MEKQITEEELSRCDGRDGRPAYVAFQGKVYDVSGSRLWSEGVHQHRHQAGKDLTAEISAAPHGESVFQRISPIGTLVAPGQKAMHPLLRLYLDLHPHPVSVHFPIALTLASAGFLICHLATGIMGLVDVAYYTLLAAAVMSPVAVLAGVSSWWYNYQHKLTVHTKAKPASPSSSSSCRQSPSQSGPPTAMHWPSAKPRAGSTSRWSSSCPGWCLAWASWVVEIVFPSKRKTGNQV